MERFPGLRIVVLGDVILDRYWWGNATRISPEAPVPVVRRERSTVRPGGAANTAANLAALGGEVLLFGVTGTDSEAIELAAALAACNVASDLLFSDPGRPTTSKTRVVAVHQQIVRVDDETDEPIADQLAAEIVAAFRGRLAAVSAVVLSDYAKGFLTAPLLSGVIGAARERGIPVLVDPKEPDPARYSGATLLKPNRPELSALAGMPVRNHAETVAAGIRLSAKLAGPLILVTEGADGMTLFSDGAELEHVRTAPRQVYDVTGAGDTVLATLAIAAAAGAPWRAAMELASEAAAIAIGQMGTAAVTRDQLMAAVTA